MAVRIFRSRLAVLAALVAPALALLDVGCTRRPAAAPAVMPDHGAVPDPAPGAPRLLTPADLMALPSRAPDRRLAYGADSSQYGELRVPAGRGPHPVVVLIHGGCWKAAYATAHSIAPIADALKADGIATWNIEYRRLGEPGGAWPGLYLDVGRAVDHLRSIAGQYALDLSRVVVVGHSSGGQLAMWVAARARLPRDSPVRTEHPLPIRGVVSLAGMPDLEAYMPGEMAACGDTVVEQMLGGAPAAVPDRYAQASAIKLLPLGVPQVLIAGGRDTSVPPALAQDYARAATQAGDSVRLVIHPDAGHFESASPRSPSWPVVRSAIQSLLAGTLPP